MEDRRIWKENRSLLRILNPAHPSTVAERLQQHKQLVKIWTHKYVSLVSWNPKAKIYRNHTNIRGEGVKGSPPSVCPTFSETPPEPWAQTFKERGGVGSNSEVPQTLEEVRWGDWYPSTHIHMWNLKQQTSFVLQRLETTSLALCGGLTKICPWASRLLINVNTIWLF